MKALQVGERREEISLLIFMVDHMFEKITNNGKRQGRKGIPLSNTSLTYDLLTSSAIQKDRGRCRTKKIFHPFDPFSRNAFGSKHLNNNQMLHQVKRLFKVQLKDNNLPLGMMTLMQKLKSPAKAVLISFSFDKTILIFMDDIQGDILKSISQ
jgi:hypothetical protein